MTKSIVYLILIFTCVAGAQTFPTGLVIDSAKYSNIPRNTKLMRGDYDNLPAAVSLKPFCPTPGNQWYTQTCAGWSSAYAGRTILESMKFHLSKAEVNARAFSPSFVYNQIRLSNDCSMGTYLTDALELLKTQGCSYLTDFGFDCDVAIRPEDKAKANKHRIVDYRQISSVTTDNNQALLAKKSLAEYKPVIIAMDVPKSFHRAGEVWTPDSSEYRLWNAGHGIAVIGYDDTKYGGALQLMNSWGTAWGDSGFTWIRYSDYNFFCQYAYELIDYTPSDSNSIDIEGSLVFKEDGGEVMATRFSGKSFITKKAYPTGTLFELRISNTNPAYVYAFSTDATGEIFKIFPQSNKISAFLPYHQNNVAIPDEDTYNELDSVKGTTYYCFLYAKSALSFEEVIRKIQAGTGDFKERVWRALEGKVINMKDVKFTLGEGIQFSGKSRGKSVLPIIMEIKHQ